MVSQAQIEDQVAYVYMSTGNWCLSYEPLAAELVFEVGKTVVQAALRGEGFHTKLAMSKPLISE